MIGDKENVRYALVQKGLRTLYVVGLNPSTANDTEADNTMKRVMKFAEYNGFDGFVMLNLYPQRATHPSELHRECDPDYFQNNLKIIEQFISEEDGATVLLAYGNNIGTREYLKESQRAIIELCKRYNAKIVCVALTKYGIPKHPLYAKLGNFIGL